MAKKRRRRSAFVPRLLVPAAAVVSVVPACVLASCSSNVGTQSSASSSGPFGVAAVAYPAYEAGTDAPSKDGASDAHDGGHPWGVAAVAYPAYEAGPG
jgi:hypothetical protein